MDIFFLPTQSPLATMCLATMCLFFCHTFFCPLGQDNGQDTWTRHIVASWQWHRTGSRWFPVRTLQVAPLWCDLGFVPNSRGNKAAANLRPALRIAMVDTCWCFPNIFDMHIVVVHSDFTVAVLNQFGSA